MVLGLRCLLLPMLIGLSHAAIALSWFAVYAYGVTTLAAHVRSARPWIERVSAIVLIGFAVRLLQLPR